MSYFNDNWYWLVTAAASAAGLLWLNVRGGAMGAGISPQEAVMRMNREKAQVIDVSAEPSYKAGHIRGARHIPLAELKDGAKGLPSNKKIPLLVICNSGIQSMRGMRDLKAMGFENVESIKGGMRAWREAQLPTESTV
jgi:rhodanese-related sulfurtransferase